MQNYENIESQRTKLQIATQEQKVKEQCKLKKIFLITCLFIEAETVRKEARIRAESEAEIKQIEMQRMVAAKQAEKQIEDIQNSIFTEREKSKADAHHYKIKKMIEAEQQQLTPQYLRKLAIESFSKNNKVYFGESIPKFMSANVDPMVSMAQDGI